MSSFPRNHWKVKENHRKFLNFAAQKLGVKNPIDWGTVTNKDIFNLSGRGFIQQHKGSLFNALKFSYPEIDWKTDWFASLPRNHWSNTENHRTFFEQFAKKNNITSPSDWHKVSLRSLIKAGGISVLTKYEFSLISSLKYCFPEIEWKVQDFNLPKKYWNSKENQRAFLEDFAKVHNIKSPRDWGKINRQSILENGGYSLFAKYSSIFDMLTNIYEGTEVKWKREWFRIPKYNLKHWEIQENQLQFLNLLAVENRIQNVNDWHRVSISLVKKNGGKGLLRKYNGSLSEALKRLYPLTEWNHILQVNPATLVSKKHKEIYSTVSLLFPFEELAINFRKTNVLK